jgi:hypothetical protein
MPLTPFGFLGCQLTGRQQSGRCHVVTGEVCLAWRRARWAERTNQLCGSGRNQFLRLTDPHNERWETVEPTGPFATRQRSVFQEECEPHGMFFTGSRVLISCVSDFGVVGEATFRYLSPAPVDASTGFWRFRQAMLSGREKPCCEYQIACPKCCGYERPGRE